MKPIIEVNHLAKKYRIGEQQPYLTLRDSIAKVFLYPLKHLSNLQKDEFWALHNLNFSVSAGDVVGIVGRNGAGKSTLLKILARITPPTDGEVILRGRVGSLLEVGTGFQQELTGRENIYLNGAILGMSQREIKRKFEEIVTFADVERFIDTPVKHYSSGMYMRLGFSVAAHLEPEILLVDEVLAVGDAEFQKKCLGKINQISSTEGRTIIFVSHNYDSIKQICNKTLLLKNGQIKSFGPTDKVLSEYAENQHGHVLSRTWRKNQKPPTLDGVMLKKVYITGENGNSADTLSTDDQVIINIEYEVTKDNSYIGFTVVLYDENDHHLFSSISNSDTVGYNHKLKMGHYTTRCIFPGKLLNNRQYSVDLNIYGQGFSQLRTLSNIISFNINDGPLVRKDYFGEYGGSLRPLLEWITIKK